MSDGPKQFATDMQDRLSMLDEQFNTNKGFGLMGVLQAQQDALGGQTAEPEAQVAEDASKQPEWFEPLNSQLRVMQENNNQQLNSLRSELGAIRQQQTVPVQQQRVDEFGEVDPYAQKIGAVDDKLDKMRLNVAWERARNSLNAAKLTNKDFDYSEDELKQTWLQHIGNNVQAAESTDWDRYYQQQYDSRMKPRLDKEVSQLRAEIAQLKGGNSGAAAGMGSVPRGNRVGAPARASSNSDFDEDVYQRASKRMGTRIGSFMGFNKLLSEEQNRKLLRSAS